MSAREIDDRSWIPRTDWPMDSFVVGGSQRFSGLAVMETVLRHDRYDANILSQKVQLLWGRL